MGQTYQVFQINGYFNTYLQQSSWTAFLIQNWAMQNYEHTYPNITGTLHERHAISIIGKMIVCSTIWLG